MVAFHNIFEYFGREKVRHSVKIIMYKILYFISVASLPNLKPSIKSDFVCSQLYNDSKIKNVSIPKRNIITSCLVICFISHGINVIRIAFNILGIFAHNQTVSQAKVIATISFTSQLQLLIFKYLLYIFSIIIYQHKYARVQYLHSRN